MSVLVLEAGDRAMLRGDDGRAAQLAMEIVVDVAEVLYATRLIDVESTHIDGCLAVGQVSADFPALLASHGGRVRVPSTLNVSSLDLLHPDDSAEDAETRALAKRIMDTYVEMGAEPTWTCAPYLLEQRPAFGTHVAWAESNAIAFVNSVLGARTGRYGDFFDICAALTGRVPYAGLHVTENRRARAVFTLRGFTPEQLAADVLFALLGYIVGERTGTLVPAVDGLPDEVTEDQLKAFGAAAAAAGSVALFHAVGATPEAPTLDAALGGGSADIELDITPADVRAARDALDAEANGELSAVSVGTPHFSIDEFEQLRALLSGRPVHGEVRFYASTGRQTHAQLLERGWLAELEALGVRIVTDTCTYVRPFFDLGAGIALTNSAKWAYYAPMTVDATVALAGLRECVESAVAGRIVRDDSFWDAR
jgi:predicted aconitase